jgi:hypothetical protein
VSSEGAVAPVAVDASNPWGGTSEPTPALGPTAPEEGGWANFESAGFADFEANFGTAAATDATDVKSTTDCKHETEKTDSSAASSTSLTEGKHLFA